MLATNIAYCERHDVYHTKRARCFQCRVDAYQEKCRLKTAKKIQAALQRAELSTISASVPVDLKRHAMDVMQAQGVSYRSWLVEKLQECIAESQEPYRTSAAA